MGQKAGEKWAAAANLQPAIPSPTGSWGCSSRILAPCASADAGDPQHCQCSQYHRVSLGLHLAAHSNPQHTLATQLIDEERPLDIDKA
jgi:hypothetical protein